jgi:alpha-1,2-mannosyltransferase
LTAAVQNVTIAAPGSLSRRFSGGIPDRKRAWTACGFLLAIEIAIFMFVIAGTHGLIVPLPRPISTDFVSFYAAGSLADAGAPQLAYDKAEHYAAEERATEAGIEYNFFYYPPIFLLLCAAFAHLPYLAAFLLFEGATLILYLVVARHILGERGWAVLVPLLAFPPVLWTLGFGQNALLTAALFGAATFLVDRRPLIAGILFGALCYKPHFGLLVPVALAAGRRWPTFAAAFVSVAAFFLLSLILFGWQTWQDFLLAASTSSAVYGAGRIPFSSFITTFGAVRFFGGAPSVAYAAQAGANLVAAALVAFVWYRDLPLPIRAAALISATLVAVPVALFYDLALAAVAAAWLLRADGKYRLADWGKVALAGLSFFTIYPRGIAELSHLPIGLCVTLALGGLVATVALRSKTRVPLYAEVDGA